MDKRRECPSCGNVLVHHQDHDYTNAILGTDEVVVTENIWVCVGCPRSFASVDGGKDLFEIGPDEVVDEEVH